MKTFSISVLMGMTLLVAGCSTTSSQNQSRQSNYQPIVAAASQKTIVRYVPVDIPGQLMPVPTITATPVSQLTGEAAVDAANQAATEVPNSADFINSTMVYNYMPGEIYTIYAAPVKITDIILAPGEKLLSEAAGDTLRWQIASTYSGAAGDQTEHILVKPSTSNLTNTMVITTDQHVYHLLLQSTQNSYMASVQWNYPGNMVTTFQQEPVSPPGAASAGNLESLDFNYAVVMVKGWKPDWFPVRVFSDNNQTYIQMPPNYPAIALPAPYLPSHDNTYSTTTSWRYQPPYIVINTVLPKLQLQNAKGVAGKTIVEIDHT